MAYLYLLTFPDGMKYVGSSVDPVARWNCGFGYKQQSELWDRIEQCGWRNVHKYVCPLDVSVADMREYEKAFMLMFPKDELLNTIFGKPAKIDFTIFDWRNWYRYDSTNDVPKHVHLEKWQLHSMTSSFNYGISGLPCEHNDLFNARQGATIKPEKDSWSDSWGFEKTIFKNQE